MKLLFVCTGNTCRSPMAEAIFRKKIQSSFLGSIIACESAGTNAFSGDTATREAVLACKKRGIDLTSHRSRPIHLGDLQTTDLFVCMTPHQSAYLRQYGISPEKVYVPSPSVCDPFGGSQETYEVCCREIENMIENLISDLTKRVIITEMTQDHIPQIAILEKECFSHPWSETSLTEELYNEHARFYTALLNGETVGYAGMHCVCGECYIDNIAVCARNRQQGIATALIHKLCAQAQSEQSLFITLEVRKSNVPARKLYEKFGFSPRGIRRNFYTDPPEDAVIYTLDLGQETIK